MRIDAILIVIFLTSGIFSNTVNAEEKNFGIKGFNLNREYVEPKNCDRVIYQNNSTKDEHTHKTCNQSTTVFEELFHVDYKLLDDKIYEANFELQIMSTYLETFALCMQSVSCVESFMKTGKWPSDSYLPKFKTDYSKFSNLIIERINESIGKFNSNKKTKETTPIVRDLLQKDVKETIKTLGSFNNRRQLIGEISKQKSQAGNALIGVHMASMVAQCLPNCNVDKYRFEWKRKDLDVVVDVFVPEHKNTIALNYHVNINYVNPGVKRKVQLLKDELDKKNSLELENQKRFDRERERDQMLFEEKVKQEEINERKKDF